MRARKADSLNLASSLSSTTLSGARWAGMTGAHAVTTSAKVAGRVSLDARRAYGSEAAARGEADSSGAQQAERTVTRYIQIYDKAAGIGGRATSAAGARLSTRLKKSEALAREASENAAKLGANDTSKMYVKMAERKAKASKRAGRLVKAGDGVQRIAGKQYMSRSYRTLQRYGAGDRDATEMAGNSVKRAGLKAGAVVGKKTAKGAVKLSVKGGQIVKRLAGSALHTIGSTLASAVGSVVLPTLVVIGIVTVPVLAVAFFVSSLSSMFSNAGEGGESDAELLAAVADELPERSAVDAQTIAFSLIETRYGEWDTEEERMCLIELWDHESGWDYRAVNLTSGAYGIPQALPARKMENIGTDWIDNPETQIKWGLFYIRDRYESPCRAWEFWQHPTEEPLDENWY